MAVAMRIDPAVHAKLCAVAKATGASLSHALSAAVESYRREVMIAAMNADYQELRADPLAWAAEERERALWDQTNRDGLADERPSVGQHPKRLPRRRASKPSKVKGR